MLVCLCFFRLSINDQPAGLLGLLAVMVEEHRLADAPQASNQDVVSHAWLVEVLAKPSQLRLAVAKIGRIGSHARAIGAARTLDH